MKKLLLATLLAGSAIAASAQDITFAMEPSYPPFEMTNTQGEIIGFDVDIATAICKEIQANCSFTAKAFDALIPSLIKVVDLIWQFPLSILPKRVPNKSRLVILTMKVPPVLLG